MDRKTCPERDDLLNVHKESASCESEDIAKLEKILDFLVEMKMKSDDEPTKDKTDPESTKDKTDPEPSKDTTDATKNKTEPSKAATYPEPIVDTKEDEAVQDTTEIEAVQNTERVYFTETDDKKGEFDMNTKETEDKDQVETILEAYNSFGEILYFRQSGWIVTDPGRFKNYLVNCLINHDLTESRRDVLKKVCRLCKNCCKCEGISDVQSAPERSNLLNGIFLKKYLDQNERTQQYWEILQDTSLGKSLNSTTLFVPLLISEASEKAIKDAELGYRKESCEHPQRLIQIYKFENIVGNATKLFHEVSAEVIGRFRLQICYNKDLEKRTDSHCLVSALYGTAGFHGKDGVEKCLVCSEMISGQRVLCSSCQGKICIKCTYGLEKGENELKKCPDCKEDSIFSPENSPWETQFFLSQYQNVEGTECQHSIQIEFRGKDKSEIRNAAEEFNQILVKVSKKLDGSVEKSFADKDGNFSYNFFIAAALAKKKDEELLQFIKTNQEENLGNMNLNLSITYDNLY